MTTIAYDSVELAADCMVVYSGCLPGKTDKIWNISKDIVLACAGDVINEWRAIQFFKKRDWVSLDPIVFEGGFAGILLYRGTPYVLTGSTVPVEIKERCFAVGSGADFARAAMELGKTAKEAVQFASKFDVNTSHEVHVYPLPKRVKNESTKGKGKA